MNLTQFLLALRGRLGVFLALLGATLAAALIVTLVMPKTYVATASLLVDNRDEQSLSGTVPSSRERLGWMQTQVDIIQSDRTAAKVSRDLRLGENPAAREQFQAAKEGGSIDDWIGKGLLARLKVNSSQSNVIQLAYSSSDPKFAAQVANAFAKAYMDLTLQLRVEPTKQAAAWFDDQLKELRNAYEDAQAKLNAYQTQHGIVATDEKLDLEMARLQALDTQALAATNSAADAASRLSQVKGRPEDNPDVLGNPLIQSLKGEVLRQEAALQELSTRLGPNHPQYRQQAAQVKAMRARLGGEVRRIIGGVQSISAQQHQRENELKAALAVQRKKVMDMREARAGAMVLVRDVETAQKAYEAALARFISNKVESAARTSNVTMLSPAVESSRPARPRLVVNLVLGLAMGLLLGFAAVFLLELLDRRVRSSTDLEAGLDAPLLGELQVWRPSRLLGGPDGTAALPRPA